jgi:WD40 repeat protein
MPPGHFLLVAYKDCAKLWGVESAETLRIFDAGRSYGSLLRSAMASPDGSTVITASDGGTARLWDAKNGELLHILDGHLGSVSAVAFSPDSTKVVTASSDCSAKMWVVASGMSVIQHTRDRSHVWLARHGEAIRSVSWSPCGRNIVTSAGYEAYTWAADECRTAFLQQFRGHTGLVTAASLNADRSFLVTASEDEGGRLWNAQTGICLRIFQGHAAPVTSAAFSPYGDSVLTTADCSAMLWETASGKCLRIFATHSMLKGINSGIFSPDGAVVVTASNDGIVRFWDPGDGECLAELGANSRRGALAVSFCA